MVKKTKHVSITKEYQLVPRERRISYKLDDNPVNMARLTAAQSFPTVSRVLTPSGKQQIGRFCSKVLVTVGDCQTTGGDVSKVNDRVRIAGEHGDCSSKQAEAGNS